MAQYQCTAHRIADPNLSQDHNSPSRLPYVAVPHTAFGTRTNLSTAHRIAKLPQYALAVQHIA
eukprot:749597-Rhodomonas_salina.1